MKVQSEITAERPAYVRPHTVAIYGMGYVGLTLAYAFADAGIPVVGIDSNESILDKLRRGEAPFFEKGLDALVHSVARSNPLRFATGAGQIDADIHVVSVGTPVRNKTPDLTALRTVSAELAGILKPGDTVILRSTVQVGTTRGIVLPILELSGLKGGRDFHLAFAPERTAEGKAIEELGVLPQVVGGIDQASVDVVARLFSRITKTIVEQPSLEAAELIKLMNNTFRDLVFSFANETALICDALNIDAFSLIEAANRGYPRNPIPLPSPGVAGSCLTKDPYLYSHPLANGQYEPVLGHASRSINERGPEYVIRKLEQFCAITGRSLADLKIMLVGLAFKGVPETSDFRDSAALEVLKRLPKPENLRVKDFVVKDAAILGHGYAPVADVEKEMAEVDAVLVMNNHAGHRTIDVLRGLTAARKPVLFFDGWHQFHQHRETMEGIAGVYYATMGYMTAR